MENFTHFLEKRTLRFSSYKNHKLKVKLWWVGARERRKRAFFTICFVRFLTFVLFQCIVYTYFYLSKNVTSYTLLLVFKIVEYLQCILNKQLVLKIWFVIQISVLSHLAIINYIKLETREKKDFLNCK